MRKERPMVNLDFLKALMFIFLLLIIKWATKAPTTTIDVQIIAMIYGFEKKILLATLFSEKQNIKKKSGEIKNFKSSQVSKPQIAVKTITEKPSGSIEKVCEMRVINAKIKV